MTPDVKSAPTYLSSKHRKLVMCFEAIDDANTSTVEPSKEADGNR